MRKIQDLSSYRDKAYINGEWRDPASGRKFEVHNPADGNVIARVSDCAEVDAEAAIEAAELAFSAWRGTTAEARADFLLKWDALIRQHSDELATIVTLEQGKPLAEATAEVAYAASFVKWFGEEARRQYGETVPSPVAGREIFVLREPIGVVLVITPWNFPLAMITRKLGAALAAGCSTIVKPAESTPLSALALARLAELAGAPAGLINVLPTRIAPSVADVIIDDPRVAAISFTGSTAVGRKVMARAAPTVKKLAFELGGNAPFIVFDDANLDRAVDGLIASKFRNAGQTCICPNRTFVQAGVKRPFLEKLVERLKSLKTGTGFEAGVNIGPLINDAAVEKVVRLVEDARDKGAQIVVGGKRAGRIYEPTILSGVNNSMECTKTEIFGPVIPIQDFDTEAQVLSEANDTPFGLAAYVYTSNHARIWRVARALNVGILGINEGAISTAGVPFGGVKQSGLGREGGRQGLLEFTEEKYVALGVIQ